MTADDFYVEDEPLEVIEAAAAAGHGGVTARPRALGFRLLDIIDMPNYNPASQMDRGEWGLRCVTDGSVAMHERDKVRCVDHGAMNAVNPDATLWRCLMCGRGAYRQTEVPVPVPELSDASHPCPADGCRLSAEEHHRVNVGLVMENGELRKQAREHRCAARDGSS